MGFDIYLMEKCFITNDLADFLNSDPNAQYSESAIINLIKKKNLSPKEISKKFPNYAMCYCGNCSVNKPQFIKFIKSNCIFKSLKPKDYCYEYNQEPVKLSQMNFDV